MNPSDFEFLSRWLRERSGLVLTPGKEYLVDSRLLPLAQSEGLADIAALVRELRRSSTTPLATAVVEAMTTNESLFFRDKKPFEDLKDVIVPELIEARATKRNLRIWCAACSTGQEPYSVLMLLGENFPQLQSWHVEVVATDLDTKAIERAKKGLYSQMEVQRGLPIQYLLKYFRQVEKSWQIIDELRHRITWKQWNLLDSFAGLGQFDMILCRNVLIYFDESLKKDIFQKLAKSLRGDGPLILGAAETVFGLSSQFNRDSRCKSSVYRQQHQSHSL